MQDQTPNGFYLALLLKINAKACWYFLGVRLLSTRQTL